MERRKGNTSSGNAAASLEEVVAGAKFKRSHKGCSWRPRITESLITLWEQ